MKKPKLEKAEIRCGDVISVTITGKVYAIHCEEPGKIIYGISWINARGNETMTLHPEHALIESKK